jgi:AraC-like DNA-binding protein
MRTDLTFDPLPRRPPTPDEPLIVNLRRPPPDVYVPAHSHDWAQLAYPLRGGIRISAAGMTWLVPALRAVWIPPHIEHDVLMLGEVELRTVYIANEVAPLPLDACSVIEVSDLMRALFETLSEVDRERPDAALRRRQMTELLLTEIRLAPPLSLGLPMPRDRRLQALCQALVDDPASPLALADWAGRVGASERTLARLFQDELQMSFGAWRQQVRLARALDLIGRGRPLGQVAAELGYASPAAFSAMFKRSFGVPPGRFMQERGGAGREAPGSDAGEPRDA